MRDFGKSDDPAVQAQLDRLAELSLPQGRLGLETIRALMERLDNPHRQLPPVFHVAGTNGKGSTCAFLRAMLEAEGYKVHVTTSPHLVRYNERIRLAGELISDAELAATLEEVLNAGEDLSPSFFEVTIAAAFLAFSRTPADACVVEVGMGGRFDATNVLEPEALAACGIAALGLDHERFLLAPEDGVPTDPMARIAFEKAGIFRVGKVAICADRDVPQALCSHAQQIGAELWCIGSEFGFKSHQNQWDFSSKLGRRSGLPHPALRGAFQLHNASAALAALDALKEKLPVSMAAVRRGLVEVQLAGRFQFVPGKPTLILDVAHNPHAARSLAQNLAGLPPCPHTYALFAMLKDKDMAGVAAALDAHIDTWLIAGITAPRGATAGELAQVLRQTGVRGEIQTFENIAGALRYAYNAAGENDRIAAFGSFHTVAEVMAEKGLRIL